MNVQFLNKQVKMVNGFPPQPKLIKSVEYQKAHGDRESGLERAVLYATSPGDLRLMGVIGY